jgi:hypothetical protein
MWGSAVILRRQKGPACKKKNVWESEARVVTGQLTSSETRSGRFGNERVSRIPFAGVKQSEREADHSAIPSPPHTCLVCTRVNLSWTFKTKVLQKPASHHHRRACRHHHHHIYHYLYHHREIYRVKVSRPVLVNTKMVYVFPSVDNRMSFSIPVQP